MKYINDKLKSRFGPFLLAGLTAVCLIFALIISSGTARDVLAQAQDGGAKVQEASGKAYTGTALTKSKVLTMVKEKKPPAAELIKQINKSGVDFKPTSADEKALTDAGASAAVIKAIKDNYRAPDKPQGGEGTPPPGNLDKDTGEDVDESGRSGFVICGNTVDTPCNVTHLFRAMVIIINYLITMAGLVAVLFIIISGVQIIISQFNGGDQSKLTAAKRKLGGAVGGLVLVAIAFVLVNSLLAGSLNIGIRNGGLILSNPREYINSD
ncbi:hypothetical protein IPM19_04500 [bacterium]|nr:MAG: hypothetical protein IPM19_04500 [bacterium]